MIPFWCLMPKGEKLRLKQMDQLPLENFENSRVNSKCLFLSKVGLLWGECLIMGKRGVFESLINFSWNTPYYASTSVFDLEIGNWVWFEKKPSGGKELSKYAKFESKTNLVLICIDVALLLVAFCCVGINHQKGGDWKGNVPLGHFYVFWWLSAQHKWFKCKLCKMVDEVQIINKVWL
jgi:hypothetical protein